MIKMINNDRCKIWSILMTFLSLLGAWKEKKKKGWGCVHMILCDKLLKVSSGDL